MRLVGILLVLPFASILIGGASADDKKATNKEKIVGVWQPTKLLDGVPPDTQWMTVEFKKNGELFFSRSSQTAPIVGW